MYRKNLLYIKFIFLLLLAWFPLWSQVMSIKNDALTLSYPLFHFFSRKLAQGHIPWWHYNLNLGFPLHADPGFPFWNPVTWIWSLAGSSLRSYSLLIFLHIVMAGIGMLRLTGWLKMSPAVRLLIAIAYPLCGFFSAHLQHPHYIFEAAVLPFVLLYFLKTFQAPVLRHALWFSISLFFLINSGYPSFVIAAVYFFALLLATLTYSRWGSLLPAELRRIYGMMGLGTGIALLLSLPFLYSLYEFYPFYNRSAGLSSNYVNTGGVSFRSLLSLLFPLASISDPQFFMTDRAWSNMYIGLLPFIFCLYSLIYVRNAFRLPLLVSGFFMLLASMQGPVKGFLYKALPMYNRMHSNGGLRIFFILSLLLLAAFGFQQWLQRRKDDSLKRIGLSLALLFAFSLVLGLLFLPGSTQGRGLVDRVKNISLREGLLIQGTLSLILVLLITWFRRKAKLLLVVGIGEMIMAFLMTLPYTGLGRHSTAFVQHHLDSITNVYEHRPGKELIYEPMERSDRFFNDPVLFISRPGLTRSSTYPSAFSSYYELMKDSTAIARLLPGLKFAGDGLSGRFKNFKPGDSIIVPQNFYRNWKFEIDGSPVTARPSQHSLTAIAATKANFVLTGSYEPHMVKLCFIISIFAWLAVAFLLIRKQINTHVHRHH